MQALRGPCVVRGRVVQSCHQRNVTVRAATQSESPALHPSQAGAAGLQGRAGLPKVHIMRLNVGADTAVALPFAPEKAASLKQALNALTETLAAKAKATRPQRWPMMEWKLQDGGAPAASGTAGDASPPSHLTVELEQMEVICNPNGHSSVFDAKALISLRTKGGLRVTTEARVPSLQADLDAFLSSL